MSPPKLAKRFKALWVLPTLDGGGAERAIVTILKHLDRQRIEPTLCLFHKRGTFLQEVKETGIPIVSLDNGRFTPNNLYQLSQLIRQIQPDVTIGVLRRCSIITAIAHKLSGNKGKIIFNEQNTPSVEMKQYGHFVLKRMGYRPFLRIADGVIVSSQGIADDLAQHFQVYPRKIYLIPNPVEIEMVREKSKKIVEHPWYNDGFQTVVTVGRLHSQKGHDILIKAFAQVKTAVPQAKLIIVGTGSEKEALLAQISNLGLMDEVDLVGFQDNPYPFVAQANLFVLASRYEGFGIVIAEALALNTAVIATDCPSGPADILDQGRGGTLISLNNPSQLAQVIITILNNPETTAHQKQHALNHVQHYSETAVSEQYMHLFKKLL